MGRGLRSGCTGCCGLGESCVVPQAPLCEGCCLKRVEGDPYLRWPKSRRSSADRPRQFSTTVWTDAASAAASCLL